MSGRRPGTEHRRAVVTGLGVVAPNGVGTESFWKAVQEGVTVLGPVTREGCAHLPLRVAGEVSDFDADGLIESRFLVQTDRFTHFAMAAADLALADARLEADERDPFAIGVVTAAGSGGGEFGQGELQRLWGQGPHFVGPYQSIAWFYAASTGQISIRGGFQGPCGVVTNDEAGGLDAIAQACRSIRHGTDAIVVGATEAPLAPYSVICQLGYPQLSLAEDPRRAYLPFTDGACGFSPPKAARCSWWRTSPPLAAAAPGSGPWSPDTPRPSPAPRAGTGPGKASPARSRAPWTRRAAAPRTWTWCSRTPWACPRPTRPKPWPSPTPSARAAGASR